MRALALVLLAAGCGGGSTSTDAAPPDVPAAPDASTCPQHWMVVQTPGPTTAATISGGQLHLSAANVSQGVALEVLQSGLTGDFDTSFVVSSFTAGGSGAFLQAGINQSGTAEFLTAGIGTVPTVGISAADQPSGASDIKATAQTAVTFRFQRAGTSATVTATTSDQTATVTTTFASDPLTIGLELGSNGGFVTGETDATIDDFTLTGSGVHADSFDCDSLIQ